MVVLCQSADIMLLVKCTHSVEHFFIGWAVNEGKMVFSIDVFYLKQYFTSSEKV